MKSEKIKYRNNWYYVDPEDLNEPSIKQVFLFSDPDLTQVVKKGNKTLMVKKEDMKDQLKEWSGAGFSMGSSIFPVNRGGQMNRGGFGGASNLGGPNMMYTYEIKPLTRNLQPKPTNFEIEEKIHVGHFIEGQELNRKDKKLHRGTVLRIQKNEDHEPMYYVILCDKLGIKINIDPTTAVLLSGENYVNLRNGIHNRSNDEADLVRAGQMQETMKAKFVKQTLNEGEFTSTKWNIAQQILILNYGYDPEDAYFLLQDLSMENYSLGDLTANQIAKAAVEWDEESRM